MLEHAALSSSSGGRPPSRTFLGVADEIPIARRWAVSRLPGGSGHPVADELAVIGTEFATNAIQHTASGEPGGSYELVVGRDQAGRHVVGVYDLGGKGEPTPRPPDLKVLASPDLDAPDGYSIGLHGVSELAAAWGTERLPDGRRYTWAAISS